MLILTNVASAWCCRLVIIEAGQRRHKIHHDGVLVGGHVVLDVGYESQCNIELFFDEVVVGGLGCDGPHLL